MIARKSAAAARALLDTLETSTKFRVSFLALSGLIIYLLIGNFADPGFTHFWRYHLFQTSLTLALVTTVEVVFAREGGLAWETLAIIVITTLADVTGTAGHMYDRFDPYDKIVHFWSGAAFAAGVFEVLGFLRRRGRLTISIRKQ